MSVRFERDVEVNAAAISKSCQGATSGWWVESRTKKSASQINLKSQFKNFPWL